MRCMYKSGLTNRAVQVSSSICTLDGTIELFFHLWSLLLLVTINPFPPVLASYSQWAKFTSIPSSGNLNGGLLSTQFGDIPSMMLVLQGAETVGLPKQFSLYLPLSTELLGSPRP